MDSLGMREYGNPFSMFAAYLVSPESGDLSEEYVSSVLGSEYVAAVTNRVQIKAEIGVLRGGSSYSAFEDVYEPYYQLPGATSFLAGNWQLRLAVRCDAESDAKSGCCGSITTKCTLTGLVSKEYRFTYTSGGNIANIVTTPAVWSLRMWSGGRSGRTFYIWGNLESSWEGSISLCPR